MQPKTRRKLPRTAIEDLTQACELMGKCNGQPASQIFERYLKLIDKYDYYFFSEPWPAKYDFTKATTFTEDDMQFLVGKENVSEAMDRFDLICLKKIIAMEGSTGYWGLFWAHQALQKKIEAMNCDGDPQENENK